MDLACRRSAPGVMSGLIAAGVAKSRPTTAKSRSPLGCRAGVVVVKISVVVVGSVGEARRRARGAPGSQVGGRAWPGMANPYRAASHGRRRLCTTARASSRKRQWRTWGGQTRARRSITLLLRLEE
ncbi:hypothetical protein CISG_08898 [Coccidioides immitis RMSCC 3703]|uniref:Uncharacterized protein n=1 Tax=Coccidioides immitis RMSCC 3703 TaxID=454286 RepID=A0A0J8R7V5_COCIT|nr:hypothetical protein CISG_08898 [Coccidioides immitis RMSCC 3703]